MALEKKGDRLRAHGVGRTLGLTAIVTALWVSPVTAQFDDIPAGIIRERAALNPQQRAQIQAYINAHAPLLGSDKPAERSAARVNLRRPLMDSEVSVSFRIDYSADLTPRLRELIRRQNRESSVAAILLAGELATFEAAQLAVSELSNTDPIIRYQAAYAIGLTLNTAARRSPAMTADQCMALVTALGQRIKFLPNPDAGADEADPFPSGSPQPVAVDPQREETDPWVLDRIMRSLAAAMEGDSATFEPVRRKATRVLCSKTIARMRTEQAAAADAMVLEVLLRGVQTIERSFLTATHDRQTLQLIIALGADALRYVAAVSRTIPADDPRRELLLRLTSAGENTVQFVRGQIDGRNPENFEITKALTDGNQQDFRRRVDRLIGADGVLIREPYSLRIERFR
ncbi:MAG: hypothetical protein KF866_08655 [Phycisphaeraceae bacterium]|nr:hypothetical protein [Phycisphaeraceae bacterium]MCW5753947.1 hypothetical protein [Phycisphaeraceae bacterium]